jgi:hypothetical protein
MPSLMEMSHFHGAIWLETCTCGLTTLLFYVLLISRLEENVSLLLPRLDLGFYLRYYYFIVDEDGAQTYIRVCSLHHFSWLDFWSFPSLELNGYIFLGAYVMCKGSLFNVWMNILVLQA